METQQSNVGRDGSPNAPDSHDLTSLYHALEREAVTALAHRYWRDRGCPEGSALEDWLRAEQDVHRQTELGFSVHDCYQFGPVLHLPH
jgi:hypothetical protein